MTEINAPGKVHLGGLEIAEGLRMAQLESLKSAVEEWAKKHELWIDSGWKVPHEYNEFRPRRGEALFMYSDGGLVRHIEEYLEQEFLALIEAYGFYYESVNGALISLVPIDETSMNEFHRMRLWQWVRELAGKRLFDIHSEVYEFFSIAPEKLAELSWRQYEEFLDAVFRNQGYRTELGSGGNDGGVDIRLYQSETIPELVTLVQAKRYVNTPIKQDAVASLFGVTVQQRAQKAIFATTSRFQPKAKAFAKSVESSIDFPALELVDSSRVGEWCAKIADDLNRFFAGGENVSVPPTLVRPPTELTGRIVVARQGYNMTYNVFAIIETDLPHEVILRTIGKKDVSGDGQRGTEVPELKAECISPNSLRFVAFKSGLNGGGPAFWDGDKLYTIWDGTPQCFDYCD